MDYPSEFPPSWEPDIWEDWYNAHSDLERREILLLHGVPPELRGAASQLFPSVDCAVAHDCNDPEVDKPEDVPLPSPKEKGIFARLSAIVAFLSGLPGAAAFVRSVLRAICRLFS